ncbi:hypothetical protein GCM10027280_26200 [Micromonospora polyrhachis]|uniref:Sulfopyruvate decarboxylase TPP-binding subunit n=1 Tax=Micromonospora polyrhachis TaxID=1282883 RepID=A0A7W7SMW6_9ACTN|nr:thiamine pyrophosphate-binding protein [Micromonospora polyrhachis]MBB4957714.1 sulfopyruvate decarboxylase TPP-binding subunit [Micromonospora polyrhachis]
MVDWSALLPAEIDHIIAVPDSLLSPVIARVVESTAVDYLQTVHESQAVALAAGLALAGRQPLLCMENSGLRAACETIARLALLHQLPILCLVSHRGEFGDPNWWAQDHSEHMSGIIALFHLRSTVVRTTEELTAALRAGSDVVRTRMRSVVVIASTDLLEGLRRAIG